MTTKEPRKYIFEMPIKVRDYEVDAEGIVNNAVYLHYFEHTRHEFCEQAGMSFRSMHESGIDPVVRRIEVEYLSPLGLGQSMVSKLGLRRKGALFVFQQDIFTPEGEPVARANVYIASVENGRLGRGAAIAEAFKDYME